jgi:hypothetical protein
MTQDDCKLITEKLLGEKWNEGYWWCPYCGEAVDPHEVTNSEKHEYCQYPVEWGENRTFKDPQDFFACFEKLVELGRWNLFMHYAMLKYDGEYIEYRQMAWLLSRTESGHYRLCVLCAEWLKEKERVLK